MYPSALLRHSRVGGCTVSLARYAPHQQLAPHVHEQDGLSIVMQGDVVEEVGHASIAAGAGWTAVRPHGTAHANRFGPRGAVVIAVVPLARALEELPRAWQWTPSALAYRAGLRLLDGDEDALVELLGEVGPHEPSDRTVARRARRLVEELEKNASVAGIARVLGLHPVYVARRFRQAYGLSIREYRKLVMVRRAAGLALATRLTLRRIAHDCGFADQSHMCRTFRTVTGWSPGLLRS
jgi:AraC family transcriptional regulator